MFSNPKAETGPKVIVLRGDPLSDKEVDQALQIGDRAHSALIQLIDQYRQQHALTAAGYVHEEKPLAAAGEIVAYESLTGLINDLESRRPPIS